jgi:hypothetical protein
MPGQHGRLDRPGVTPLREPAIQVLLGAFGRSNHRRANGARRKPSSPSCSKTGSSWHDGQPAPHTRFLIVPAISLWATISSWVAPALALSLAARPSAGLDDPGSIPARVRAGPSYCMPRPPPCRAEGDARALKTAISGEKARLPAIRYQATPGTRPSYCLTGVTRRAPQPRSSRRPLPSRPGWQRARQS